MIRTIEIYHFEGRLLYPEVRAIPKSDGQVDMPDWHRLLPRHDAMEWCSARLDPRPIEVDGIRGFRIHDVEAAASIHQHLGEAFHANDLVDREWASSWQQDML